jgi:hypothetical protein
MDCTACAPKRTASPGAAKKPAFARGWLRKSEFVRADTRIQPLSARATTDSANRRVGVPHTALCQVGCASRAARSAGQRREDVGLSRSRRWSSGDSPAVAAARIGGSSPRGGYTPVGVTHTNLDAPRGERSTRFCTLRTLHRGLRSAANAIRRRTAPRNCCGSSTPRGRVHRCGRSSMSPRSPKASATRWCSGCTRHRASDRRRSWRSVTRGRAVLVVREPGLGPTTHRDQRGGPGDVSRDEIPPREAARDEGLEALGLGAAESGQTVIVADARGAADRPAARCAR